VYSPPDGGDWHTRSATLVSPWRPNVEPVFLHENGRRILPAGLFGPKTPGYFKSLPGSLTRQRISYPQTEQGEEVVTARNQRPTIESLICGLRSHRGVVKTSLKKEWAFGEDFAALRGRTIILERTCAHFHAPRSSGRHWRVDRSGRRYGRVQFEIGPGRHLNS